MACSDIIKDREIEDAHSVASDNISASIVDNKICDDFMRIDDIDIRQNGVSICEEGMPLMLSAYARKQLLPKRDREEKVVVIEHIRLKNDFKGKGVFTSIHQKQLEVFARNEFVQMQLKATNDGLVVWLNLHFKIYKEDDIDELYELFAVYMAEILGYNSTKIEKIFKNIDDPKETVSFLTPRDKMWFTQWYETKTPHSLSVEMYKDIA